MERRQHRRRSWGSRFQPARLVGIAWFAVVLWTRAGGGGFGATDQTTGSVQNQLPVSHFRSMVVDAAGDVGRYTSLAVVNGRPAIAYYDATNGVLKYVRANDTYGTSWTPPLTVDSQRDVGYSPSLAVVNGRPAIAYSERSGDFKYVRANDSSGTSWSTPVVVDNTTFEAQSISLTVVEGHPAIANNGYFLRYVRANDADGVSWPSPIVVEGSGFLDGYKNISLTVISGCPAIAYFDVMMASMRYLRAADSTGQSWPGPIALATPDVGEWPSLAVVDGNPAIAYFLRVNIQTGADAELRYLRANNSTGADWGAWGAPLTLDSAGDVGRWASLAVVQGRPVVAYYDAARGALKCIFAQDAAGASWETPAVADQSADVGRYASLVELNGYPAIAYYDATNGDLRFATGEPTFTLITLPVAGGPFALGTGDFNGDGHQDLAAATNQDSNIHLFLGDGAGSFTLRSVSPVPPGPNSARLVSADFNRDGKLDLALGTTPGTEGPHEVSVLLGNGDGTFQAVRTFPAPWAPHRLQAGDMNNDAIPDIVVVGIYSSQIWVLLGKGDGTFQSAITLGTPAGADGLALADFNKDGNLDAVGSNPFANSVTVFLGDGAGHLSVSGTFAAGAYPNDVAACDLDHDGNLDLAVPAGEDGKVSVLYGDGRGNFSAPQTWTVGAGPQSLMMADLDSDGHKDIAVTCTDDSRISLLDGDGARNFSLPAPLACPSPPWVLVAADFNADGWPDLAASMAHDTVGIFLASATPTSATGISVVWQRDLDATTANGITAVRLTPDRARLKVFHYTTPRWQNPSYSAPFEELDATSGSVLWSKTITKPGIRIAGAGAVDGEGNVYFGGIGSGVNFWKYDSQLDQQLWAFQAAGSGFIYPGATVIDGSNNVYVAGFTASAPNEGSRLVKLTPDGQVLWDVLSKHTTDIDAYAFGMALDSQRNVFRVGADTVPDAPASRGRILGHRANDGQEFLSVSVVEPNSAATGVATDAQDNIYIAYSYNLWAAYQTRSGEERTVVQKLDPSGVVLWEYRFPEVGLYTPFDALAKHGDYSFYLAFHQKRDGQIFPGIAAFNADGRLLWRGLLPRPGWEFGSGLQLEGDSLYVGLNNLAATSRTQVLKLALRSAGLPNLTIDNSDFSPAAPTAVKPGDSINLEALIENNGGADSGPCWLEFWGSRTGGLTLDHFVAESVLIGPIAAGGSYSFAGTKPLWSFPDGAYTVVFAADRPHQVQESDETDNRRTVVGKRLLVLRPETGADLMVEGFSFSPASVANGQAISLGGRVRNTGTENSGPFWIEFWGSRDRVYPQLDFFLCDSIPVPDLAPGAALNLGDYARTLYECPAGVFLAGVFADRPDQVNERNEANNYSFVDGIAIDWPTMGAGAGAAAHLAAGPDLVVAGADFAPWAPAQLFPGQPITLRARVENRGTVRSGPFWVEFFGSKVGGLSLDEFVGDSIWIPDIPAGGAADLELTRPLYSVPDGPYTIVVVADRPNQVIETDEANNRLAVGFKRLLALRPATQANLTVESLAFGPNPIHRRQGITLAGRVRNTGTQDSGPFWIEFWGSRNEDSPELGFFLCDSVPVLNLAPGGAIDLSTIYRALYARVPVGDCAVICFVDRTDLVNETNETDNYAVLRGFAIAP